MDPNFKLILDEIQKSKDEFARRFDEHDAQWERRFADIDRARTARSAAVDKHLDALEAAYADTAYTVGKRISALEAVCIDQNNFEQDDRVTALEVAATDLGTWRPEVEALVDDLKIEVKKLAQERDRQVFDAIPLQPGIVASPSSASVFPATGVYVEPPRGHSDASSHRDGGFGSVTTLTHVPVMGDLGWNDRWYDGANSDSFIYHPTM